MRTVTKAHRIFYNTYWECRNIVRRHGYDDGDRLNDLVTEDGETICTRTLNAVQKRLDDRLKNGKNDETALLALKMVQNTIDHQRAILKTLVIIND